MNYYQVLVCKGHSSRRFFTYNSDNELELGSVVEVIFGRQKLPAIIIQLTTQPAFKTSSISKDLGMTLPSSSLKLLNWMLNFYPDDYGSIGAQFLPSNLKISSRKSDPKIILGDNSKMPAANEQQLEAIKLIEKNDKNILLGITGSGKTRVFTEQIIKTLKSGKSVFVLTPEIGLTPQLVKDIKTFVNSPIIVNHSLLSPAEKKRIWSYANSAHQPTIYVGPRSTIFVPDNHIGLVVVDEFHDASFKQQNSPRYSALHLVSSIAKNQKAKIILSSATPTVSDFYLMQRAGYQLATLDTLAVSHLPATSEIVDTNDRTQFLRNKYFSDTALEKIKQSLQAKEQILVYLNRRGTARLVQCTSCGWQANCKSCGLPMTYHHDFFQLLCHACGTKQLAPKKCPDCGSVDIAYKSVGTKTIVDQLQSIFPKSKIARFDADNKAADKLHKNIDFLKNNDIDIIVGTQLIAKGLDLPHLSLAVVINADSSLALPDFSAEEQLFSQLYQVTGRVGRGHRKSSYIIQTKNPSHPVMESVVTRNYQQFYNYELSKRQTFNYPPFCFLAIVKVTKNSEPKAEAEATKIANQLSSFKFLNILGPSPSFYEKTARGYTWQVIIKSLKRSAILEAVSDLSTSAVTVELDPTSLL